MKKSILASLTLGIVLTAGGEAHSRDYVAGVSPFMSQTASKVQMKSLIEFMLEEVKPGDRVLVYDAYKNSSIGTFEVPNNPAYSQPKAKLMVNKSVVVRLLKYAEKSKEPEGEDKPSVAGAINWPQFLQFVGENLPHKEEIDVILLGSPIFDDPKEPKHSMAKDYQVPADSQLGASQISTPFGTKDYPNLLSKIRVHLAYPDAGWKKDHQHEYMVKRLWTLFIEKQGGSLITFVSDLPTLFGRVKNHAEAPKHDYQVNIRRGSSENAVKEDTEAVVQNQSKVNPHVDQNDPTLIFDRALSQVPVAIGEIKSSQYVEIGITWMEPVDLDLYGRSSPQKDVLYFGRKESPEGEFVKDFTSSPKALNNGYETIRLHSADIRKLFVAINFYSGNVRKGVRGEIRISVNNKTFAHNFEIKAHYGNKGAGGGQVFASGIAGNPEWLVIDPLKMIGLR